MQADLRAVIEQALGVRVVRASPLSGGDINDAYEIELAGGARVFAKANRRAPPGLFAAEARGLDWLRAGGAIRVPEVRAFSEDGATVQFLVLELLGSERPVAGFDERLGRRVAALHRAGAGGFGLDHDNFIGPLPQKNTPLPTWHDFYRSRRLEPLLVRAASSGRASFGLRRGFDKLFARLEELVGPPEPPARLHGDLWGGNLHVDDGGEPCLIDPAVYGGHREVDLAMMRLFGGFSESVFAAYAEDFPLAPGAEERVALYQLYPLLVHANLFGGGYVASVERAVARYVGRT
jgi:fructosamine-3-kinase